MAFDIYRNWPSDGNGALEDFAPPKEGEGIRAGMAIKKNVDGELIKATGAAGELAFFAVQNQDAGDVATSGMLPYIIGNAISMTDYYQGGLYPYGTRLQVDPANHGTLIPHTGGAAPIFGWADGMVDRDDFHFLKVILGRN